MDYGLQLRINSEETDSEKHTNLINKSENLVSEIRFTRFKFGNVNVMIELENLRSSDNLINPWI